MARYPRAARSARIKCVSCNAPAVETVEDRYVCVECGDSPVAATEGGAADGSDADDREDAEASVAVDG